MSTALVVGGTIVIVASGFGALLARDSYQRLHLSTTITSLGGPLLAIGLAVHDGAGLTTASILFPTGLLFFTSPIMSAAIAKTMAQNDGRLAPKDSE